ncbi:hypothetical protein BP5796_02219 [Coleophoma crateriformis]|uniref:RecA family profile 1 domain-containing protein n=1 Tax=Coleophoma crateriformis TaxID=565419 RepID=A0A3D8SXP7_9HELO|nr:hypothetical protein BP5796_02219 [Coleophoma crateriformis]
MDYQSVHGHDVSNFSSSPPHRMPTVSAAQALEDLKTSPTRCLSTGLALLDAVLQNQDGEATIPGGVSRGKVTEVYGPPGVGKTALGMQMAANVLHAGKRVIWVDTAHPLPGPRFSQILTSCQNSHPISSEDKLSESTFSELLRNLTHFSTPTLAHFIALLCHSSTNFPVSEASLIVIDSFSTLISNAFPRTVDASATPKKPGAPNPGARKFPILQYIINALSKLAATRNIAIVVLSQCVTKMQPGSAAILVPAINTTAWDQGLCCRVALFRDWGWEQEGNEGDSTISYQVRFAEVVKAEGITAPNGRGRLVAFAIDENGLQPLAIPITLPISALPQNPIDTSPILPRKRKFSTADLEVPDSEGEDDEDYGWGEQDEETVPEMPPQWQGSEDILVPAPKDLEEEEEEEEDEEEEVEDEAVERLGVAGGIVPEVDDSEDELAAGH